ncbi:AAA family ATPase [Sorangium sp. So ce119]|uniref:ATP-binding protein n=1 Tax=Sorangium sp. So ce119 TaxID=3133279 RepID=UPI003F5EA08F
MKITFSNLGTIRRTTLDLAPLTVIIGPNNSGKTYVAYATYGLFHGGEESFLVAPTPRAVFRGDAVKIPIDKHFQGVVARMARSRSETLGGQLETFFQDSSGKLFSNTKLGLDIESADVRAAVEGTLKRWPSPPQISDCAARLPDSPEPPRDPAGERLSGEVQPAGGRGRAQAMRPGMGGDGPGTCRREEEFAMWRGEPGERAERGPGQEPAFRGDAALVDQRARLVDRDLAADVSAPQMVARLPPRDAPQPRLERAARVGPRVGTVPAGLDGVPGRQEHDLEQILAIPRGDTARDERGLDQAPLREEGARGR